STDFVALNHSGYAENSAIMKDIELLLRTGLRPPEQRMPTIAKIGTPTGEFWRYPAVRTGAP
ncbi:MAG TPA: hypothetical protein PK264_20285, partial [Hyphomicrobiaceae bacterium]|nr:hypothetical protein [Hyphomicrobiaceae bacterium]